MLQWHMGGLVFRLGPQPLRQCRQAVLRYQIGQVGFCPLISKSHDYILLQFFVLYSTSPAFCVCKCQQFRQQQ